MNWKTQYSTLLLLTTILLGCDTSSISDRDSPLQNAAEPTDQQNTDKFSELKKFANTLTLRYLVLDNVNAKECDRLVKSGLCFDAQITLEMNGQVELKNWRIYFSNMSPILEDYSDLMDITHVNGDQHFISPTSKFSGWNGNQKITIKFKAEFWHISEFDSPPNFYLVVEGHPPQLIQSTLAQIDAVTGQEFMAHMESFTDHDKQFKRGKEDQSIWHTAEKLYQLNHGKGATKATVKHRILPTPFDQKMSSNNATIDISKGLNIGPNVFQIDSSNPAVKRLQQIGITINGSQGIPVLIEQLEPEVFVDITQEELLWEDEKNNPNYLMLLNSAYELSVEEQQITIKAVTQTGAFYALQSVAGLYQLGSDELPLMKVNDKPRYAYRGFFIDVARNFRRKDFIIKLLDQMAAYKLNKFHFHLGDDEGWRLEIPGLPELTELGAKRCHDPHETQCLSPQLASGPNPNGPNDGFYSIRDYQEILQFAAERHIEVIPSFDMPGHSRAAVKSMQLRYKKYMALGDRELAEEFLLSDLNDQSKYSSVQFYTDNTLNVCKESSYRFVEKVLNEVINFHLSAEQPLRTYHIGADETAGAWKDSPECQLFTKQKKLNVEQLTGYFIQRVSTFLASKKVTPGGWSDGLSLVSQSEMPKDVHVNVWTPLFWEGHKVAHQMANRNWSVVLSNPDVTYFDFPYQADPKERGYYWGARYTNTQQIFEWMPDNLPVHAEIWKDRTNRSYTADDRAVLEAKNVEAHSPKDIDKYFYGIQAQLWSEMVRSEEIAEYLIFPRLTALAERAWYKPEWEIPYAAEGKLFNDKTTHFSTGHKSLRDEEWLIFAKILALKEMPKLDLNGVKYRLPTAGAKLSQDSLLINSAFPGLPLQYKIGDGKWLDYPDNHDGVKVDSTQTIYVRTTNLSRTRFGRTTEVNKNYK
jgi:hexosaminidase